MIAPKGLALGVALFALPWNCQEPEEPAPATDAAPVRAEAEPSPERPTREPAPDEPPSTAAAVPVFPAAAESPKPTSGAAIIDLLDLVPEDSSSFIAVRNPAALSRTLDGLLRGADHDALAELTPKWDAGVGRALAEKLSTFEFSFAASSLRPEAGLLLLPEEEIGVLAASADEAREMTEALAVLTASRAMASITCEPLSHAPGFVACGTDKATLAGLEPGGGGATLRAQMARTLPGPTLEEANILIRAGSGVGTIDAVIATRPDGIYVALGGAGFDPLDDFATAGPTRALGLFRKNAPLMWTRLPKSLLGGAGSLPAEFRTLVSSLTGEAALGGLRDGSLALVIGVKDPFPAAGMVSVLALRPDLVHKTVPAGASVKAKKVEATDGATSTLQIDYADGPLHDFATRFGLRPHAWGFSAGQYAAVTVGGDEQTLNSVADFTPGTAPPAWLPKEMRQAIDASTCALAIHVPLDTLHEREGHELFLSTFELAGGLDVIESSKLDAGLRVVAPLSSVSTWITLADAHPLFHFSVDFFGDAETPDGLAALTALRSIVEEGSSQQTYERLAKRHPAARFDARAHPSTATKSDSLLAGATLARFALDATSSSKPPSKATTKPHRKPGATRRGRRTSLARVKKNGIYTPDPDLRRIAAVAKTKAAGKASVSFCVSPAGKTDRVKISKRFRGGSERAVDELLVKTVKKWRFQPFFDAGRPRTVCTVAPFTLKFD